MEIDVADQIKKIMDAYGEEVEKITEEAMATVAKSTASYLRENSPKQEQNGGRYAQGWTQKKTGGKWGSVGYTVYNAKRPGLTHLLEHGHALANQYGHYAGSAAANPHIKEAEEKGIEDLLNELESKL